MELWIRSQDKKLLAKINYVFIQELSYKRKNKYEIQSNNGVLGYYNTQERALEVLDEIQSILNLKDMYKYDRELVLKSWEKADEEQIKTVRKQMSVYEMPKE